MTQIPAWLPVALSIVSMIAGPALGTWRAAVEVEQRVGYIETRGSVPLEQIRERLAKIDERIAVQQSELRHIRELMELRAGKRIGDYVDLPGAELRSNSLILRSAEAANWGLYPKSPIAETPVLGGFGAPGGLAGPAAAAPRPDNSGHLKKREE
jgi:hypothetical protein